jgi:hypothetical protein
MKSQDRVKLHDNRVRIESTSGNNLNRVSDKIINFGSKRNERHESPYLSCRERVSVKRVQRAVVHTGQFSEDRVSASDNKVNLGRVSDNKASRACDDRVTLLRGSGDIRDATSPFRTG